MARNIEEVREALFKTLERLGSDSFNSGEIERAKAVCEVAKEITATAKVEIDFLRVTGGTGTGFIPAIGATPTETGIKRVSNGVTVHTLRG